MSTSKKTASYRRAPISYEEFAVGHGDELAEADAIFGWSAALSSKNNTLAQVLKLLPGPPLPPLMQELKCTSFFRLLAAAGQENCPDALNFLLSSCLRRMGVRIPAGVFVVPRGTPGRPRSTSGIYNKWIEIGQPPLGGTKLAVAVFGEAFKKAPPADRVKMIDRCRKAVTRYPHQLGQNAPK